MEYRVDPYEPSNPNCLLRPEPIAADAYELNRAQYVHGLSQLAQQQHQPALDTFTSVFYALKESEDQACLNLIMYALTNACQAKLHLRQLQTCTTLCNFLIGKATGVLSLRRLLDRLLAIRNQSDADLRRLAPAMHMPNDVAPAADLLPGAAEGPMRVPGNVADNMLAEQQEDEEDAQSDDDETGFIDMDHYPPSTSHMSTTYM